MGHLDGKVALVTGWGRGHGIAYLPSVCRGGRVGRRL